MSQYQDLWFKSHDGLNLYTRDYPCTAPNEPSPKTIVCIPGLTRNSADFTQLSERLSSHFRVLAVDLRGRGKSDYDPNPENYHPGVYYQDMVALLDTLKLTQVILLGTSLGGLVSMILSAANPSRILSVILNDIGPVANPAGLDRIKSYIRKHKKVNNWDEAIAITKEIHASGYPTFKEADWRNFTSNIYRENADGQPELSYDPAISKPLDQPPSDQVSSNLWPAFETMRPIPTLVVRGELSDILSMDCVDQMRRIHPQMEYAEVPKCGHAPTLNEPKAQLAIDQFLGLKFT